MHRLKKTSGGHSHHKRVFGLDLLRAFAILTVVYGHGFYQTSHTIPKYIYNIPVFDGVTMFFVLSGYLIGLILIRTVTKDDFNSGMLMEFWIRRWFRTLPNYLFVLTFLVIANNLKGLPNAVDLGRYYVFSQNLTSPHPEFFQEAWSLSVEEWFYLTTPIPLYLSTKIRIIDRRKFILFWIAVVIISVTAFRCYMAYRYGYSSYLDWALNVRKEVVTRLDSLMFGVLAAYISTYKPYLWQQAADNKFYFIAGLAFLLFDKFFWGITHNLFYLSYFSLTLTSLGTLLLLPKLSTIKHHDGFFVSAVTFISLISYSMYLLNLTCVQGVVLPPVMDYLIKVHWIFAEHSYIARYFAYWILTLLLSFLLYRFFESPMTSLRDRFYVRGHSRNAVTAFTDSS